jgi:hypothetical protein
MISLPTPNYPVVEDTNEDSHIDQGDIQVALTFGEHELMVDILRLSIEMMDFSCPQGMFDLPIDSEIVQRYTMLENLRERFNTLWRDRFTFVNEND